MIRQWTNEEIKRLVPEAKVVGCNWRVVDADGRPWAKDWSDRTWNALIQTRLDLETAQKDLTAMKSTLEKIANHDFETSDSWKAAARQFQEWARESLP